MSSIQRSSIRLINDYSFEMHFLRVYLTIQLFSVDLFINCNEFCAQQLRISLQFDPNSLDDWPFLCLVRVVLTRFVAVQVNQTVLLNILAYFQWIFNYIPYIGECISIVIAYKTEITVLINTIQLIYDQIQTAEYDIDDTNDNRKLIQRRRTKKLSFVAIFTSISMNR